jgi:hypothetical protein
MASNNSYVTSAAQHQCVTREATNEVERWKAKCAYWKGIAEQKAAAPINAVCIADEIMARILDEMAAPIGSKVAVLVNSLGATPLMELYTVNRRVHQKLAEAGLAVHATFVGPYCTSMEMAGCSITLIHLDDELTTLLDHPCHCTALQVAAGAPVA